jgi:hypothetical protein
MKRRSKKSRRERRRQPVTWIQKPKTSLKKPRKIISTKSRSKVHKLRHMRRVVQMRHRRKTKMRLILGTNKRQKMQMVLLIKIKKSQVQVPVMRVVLKRMAQRERPRVDSALRMSRESRSFSKSKSRKLRH